MENLKIMQPIPQLFDRLMEELSGGRNALRPLVERRYTLAIRVDGHLEAAQDLTQRFRDNSLSIQAYTELAGQLRQARLDAVFFEKRNEKNGVRAAGHVTQAESLLARIAGTLLVEGIAENV
jgi:hypothetical protein